MGRYYTLSKSLKEEEGTEILSEMQALDDVKSVQFVADPDRLEVETVDGEYTDVMYKAVNIFSRVGHGCEISFSGFAYHDEDK